MTEPLSAQSGLRRWALSSLVAGAMWLVLAVAPTVVTTVIGLPFAAYALVVGGVSLSRSKRAFDKSGARLAQWGIGLGCAGFVWTVLYYVLLGGVVIASLIALVRAIPTGTPIP